MPARPSYDPELAVALAACDPAIQADVLPEDISRVRAGIVRPTIPELLAGRAIEHLEYTIPGLGNAPDIVVSCFRRTDHSGLTAGIYNIHGGGMIMGNRFDDLDVVLEWVDTLGVVAVSVEYRLAPEVPDPGPIEDCYAGLIWLAEHAKELGIDPQRIVIAGSSAGAGLAAGVALYARDHNGPELIGQCLTYPMLDDRTHTVSTAQFDAPCPWSKRSSDTAWQAYLGSRRGTPAVSIYAAPARATDLTGLPPTFIDVGSAELFRDECVAYASAIWAAGGDAELHVWPGAFHGFDLLAPNTVLAHAARTTRTAWIRRIVSETGSRQQG